MEINFTIPLTIPSVNHYKLRTRRGVTFVSAEAKKFKADLAVFARRFSGILWEGTTPAQRRHIRYELEAVVFFGKNQRGDGDNLWKCLADGLKECGVIHSDAAVSDWILRVRRDRSQPRTEIRVKVL